MADINICERTYYFSRHAEKLISKEADPLLTPAGLERAKMLAEHLSPARLSAIYATQYQRTQLTAAPTASLKGLEIKHYQAGEESLLIEKLADAPCDGDVLIIGHSNTLPSLLRAVGITETATEFSEDLYGMLYIVKIEKSSAVLSIEKVGK